MSGDRIGVFICSWGSGKDPLLDMEALRAFAERVDGVTFARIIHRACKEGGRVEMVDAIRDADADRFVVAACSPRAREGMYRSVARSAGLHPLAFEVANVRDQAAYAHNRSDGQRKAERVILMAVEKARLWSPPPFDERAPAFRDVVVVGDGMMAAMAARDLASQGIPVHLIVSGQGPFEPPSYLFRCIEERERALAWIREAASNHSVRIYPGARVLSCEGTPGDFGLLLSVGRDFVPVRCGAVVLAPEPAADLRQMDGSAAPDATALLDMGVRRVAILPQGSSSGTGCSCITPRGTLYALAALENDPGAELLLLGREVRATGGFERVQRLVQEKGAIFMRVGGEPSVSGRGPFQVRYSDPFSGEGEFTADLVLLDAVRTDKVEGLARTFELPVDAKGELLSIESRLRPGETVRKGVFVCRYRVGDMLLEDMALEAGAAAARASELVRSGSLLTGGAVAEVDQERCSACLGCVRICPYGAPRIGDQGKAEVRIELCQGCGACIGLCPSRAIDMYQFSSAQLVAQERVAMRREG